jgi:hypothetical protein
MTAPAFIYTSRALGRPFLWAAYFHPSVHTGGMTAGHSPQSSSASRFTAGASYDVGEVRGFGLRGLADLDTRHKHESESEWCQAHHVRNLLRPTLTIIHAKPLMVFPNG